MRVDLGRVDVRGSWDVDVGSVRLFWNRIVGPKDLRRKCSKTAEGIPSTTANHTMDRKTHRPMGRCVLLNSFFIDSCQKKPKPDFSKEILADLLA